MTSFDVSASRHTGSRAGVQLRELLGAPARVLDASGEQFLFYAAALRGLRLALTRYRHEVARLIAGVTFGTGALAMIVGTVVTVAFLTSFAGIELGLQGYSQLRGVGIEALSGFISAYVNTRLVAPVIAGIALVATVGAGFTAQLGAMRVSEEIDALEVMSIHTVPYLVSTRIAAGFAAVAPLYAVSVLAWYACTRILVVHG
jgi:phospholipid/cholesterol/gamma-HCH transport system permease protein